MRFLQTFFAAIVVLMLSLWSADSAYAREPFTLESVTSKVQRDYSGVSHMSADEFSNAVKNGDVLLLDVREEEEFAVSRIPGSEQVDPGIWKSTFLSKFREKARGKTVVLYCSVGVRSSKLAEKVQVSLMSAGAKGVYNLNGGVFGWHNKERALVNAKGATDFVHPFDKYWGQLLDRQEQARNKP